MRRIIGRLIRNWKQDIAPRSPLWPEYTYAAFMISFGMSLLLPNEAFGLTVNYAVLSRIATETAWGQFFVGFGGGWFAIVATHNLNARRFVAAIGAFILAWLSLSVIFSNPLSTIGLPFGVVALSAAYAAGRLIVPWNP